MQDFCERVSFMTIEEMRNDILNMNCNAECDICNKGIHEICKKYNSVTAPDEVVIEWHKKLFPKKYQIDDPVNHPSHYTKGKIEVADFIADQKLNFDRGNAVKYVCRAGSKDPEKEIQDLEKAIWYINHEIKMLKGEDADAAQKEN